MADLRATLALFREFGVMRAEISADPMGIISVEFFAPIPEVTSSPGPDTSPPIPPKSARQLLDEEGAGLCACGHPLLQHNEAGCYIGCDVEKCAPMDAPT